MAASEDELVAAVMATGRRWGAYGVQVRALANREYVDDNDRLTAEAGITPATWSGWRSLAGHKGLPIEAVVRAAVRGRLADVVDMPEEVR